MLESRAGCTEDRALLVALNPVFTILLAPPVGGRLSINRLAGVLIALLGAGIVMTHGDLRMVTRIGFNRGDVIALCAAGVWATFNLATRRVVVHIAPSSTNLAVFAFGGTMLFLLGRAEQPVEQIFSAGSVALTGLLVMAVGSSVLSGQAFLSGVRRLGVGRAVLFIYGVNGPISSPCRGILCGTSPPCNRSEWSSKVGSSFAPTASVCDLRRRQPAAILQTGLAPGRGREDSDGPPIRSSHSLLLGGIAASKGGKQ